MVACFSSGWARFADIKLPALRKLEDFGEYVISLSVLYFSRI